MSNNDGQITRFFERLLQVFVAVATIFSCYIGYLAFTRPGIVQVLLPNASPPVDSAIEGTLRATAETLQQANAGLQATITALQQENGGLQATTTTLQQQNNELQATTAALQEENTTLAFAAQAEPTAPQSPLATQSPSASTSSPAPPQESLGSSTQPANDIPGTPLAFDTSVTSLLDSRSKPRDVYAIELKRGQILRVVTESTQDVYADIGRPNLESIRDRTVLTPVCPSDTECNRTFPVVEDGTYYLKVQTGYDTGVRYMLTVGVE
jgi:cell pole-organizing protein PopZ